MSGRAGPIRRATLAGTSGLLLLLVMFLGSLGLWVGVPLAWLFVAGRVQGATHSVGAAVGVAMLGFVATVVLAMPVLGWLNRKHDEAREARGHEPTGMALEGVMVISAAIALVGFVAWFVLFSGSEPVPLGLPK